MAVPLVRVVNGGSLTPLHRSPPPLVGRHGGGASLPLLPPHSRRRMRTVGRCTPPAAAELKIPDASVLPSTLCDDGSSGKAEPPPAALTGCAIADAPLPEALRAAFPAAFPSMTAARRACRRHRVRVDGTEGACGTPVVTGQLLEVLPEFTVAAADGSTAALPSRRRPRVHPAARGIEVPVVFEDEHLAVVVKPWGIKVHATYGDHNLTAYVRALVSPSAAADALPGGPSPAHRLDRLTGGLLVCAKTKSAAAALTAQFEARQVRKRYRALVAGRLEAPPGSGPILIDRPIEGRPAVTSVTVVTHTRCLRYGGYITTLDLRPVTGRRHQLRRHLAMCLGHPILGDPLYSPWAGVAMQQGAAEALLAAAPDELAALLEARQQEGRDSSSKEDGSGSDSSGGAAQELELLKGWGMALWAPEIEFSHPTTGERLVFSTPEPSRFEKLRAQQQRRWDKFHGPPGAAAAAAAAAT